MMNSQELETAVRLKLNLVVLVLEDCAYGMIRWKQEVDGFSDFGLDFGNPDFVAYARSYGAKGSRVGKASEFSPMLEGAFREGGNGLQRKHADARQRVALGSPGQVKSPASVLCGKGYFRSRRAAEFAPKPNMTKTACGRAKRTLRSIRLTRSAFVCWSWLEPAHDGSKARLSQPETVYRVHEAGRCSEMPFDGGAIPIFP
jgi:hypothetical protein